MIRYYLQLARMRLRRNVWLTALIVIAIAVGIASSMTVFTVLYTLSGDPIPWKSSRLYAPSLDINDPSARESVDMKAYISAGIFSYTDAMAISRARKALHQAAMFPTRLPVKTADPSRLPEQVEAQATQGDLFTMFEVPFRFGGAWSSEEEEAHANVVVIAEDLAAHYFPGVNAVGHTLQIGTRDFRIVGVTGKWAPFPAFYDPLGITDAAKIRSGPQLFVPIETAVDHEFPPSGYNTGANLGSVTSPAVVALIAKEKARDPKLILRPLQIFFASPGLLESQLWVELPTAADAQRYRQFLNGYAAEWQRRFGLPYKPVTQLRSMRQWLYLSPQTASMRKEFERAGWVAFGFLLVCLVNATALMLARFARRSGDLAVRRALGAPRREIMVQCLVEAVVIGILGGFLGLLLTFLGLQLERMSVPRQMERTVYLDWHLIAFTLALALVATVGAGLYPAWRASRLQSTWELKSL